ncbi:MAG: SRPBCC family protein [Planctomycetota bacterium]|jgi:ligand-binding SRPBCC domain-containing protein
MQATYSQRLPVPRERLFAFHQDPANLIELLSGWRDSRVVAHEGHVRPGARVQAIQRLGPFRLRLTFEHVLLEPPERFAERQVRGPFRVFEHVHEFEEADGGTILRDRVTIALPLWMGGEWATRRFVRPRLEAFFAFRHAALDRLVAAGRFAD